MRALAAVLCLFASGTLFACAPGMNSGPGGQSRLSDPVAEVLGTPPPGAPEKPATALAYPAVHDMPPARDDEILTEDQQAKLQKDLSALRAKQAKETKDAGTAAKAGSR